MKGGGHPRLLIFRQTLRCRIFAQPRNQIPSQKFESHSLRHRNCVIKQKGFVMSSIIYLVGLVVVVMAVLSFVGLH